MGYERVYTIMDFFDGPRKGIADFDGQPHFYESECGDTAGEPSEAVFRLSPIEPSVFDAAMEAWRIYERWEKAYYAGTTTDDALPPLPGDRGRWRFLDQVLAARLRIDSGDCVRARGDFKASAGRVHDGLSGCSFEVMWSLVESRSQDGA